MKIRKAGLDDIDILVKLRMDFLSEDKNLTREECADITQRLEIYLKKYMPTDGFAAFIAEDNGHILSTAFLSIAERPPRAAFSSSLTGTVYNVFTYPEFRKQGIATKVMTALLEEAEKLDIVYIDLLSTNDGKYLYEKLGFSISTKYAFMKKEL